MKDDNLSPQARDLLSFMAEREYVCPIGRWWDGLWKLLPKRRRLSGEGSEPSLPLILGGWSISTDTMKAQRLREHVEWADQHGVIDKADQYLRSLEPENWHKWSGQDELLTSTICDSPPAQAQSVVQVTFVPRKKPISPDEPQKNLSTSQLLLQYYSETGAKLIEYIQANNWICPQHAVWFAIWKALPDRSDGTRIDGPLPEQAWSLWNQTLKHECLLRQIGYADKMGAIGQLDKALRQLEPSLWITKE